MLYVIEARDKLDALDVRLATRPAHLEYLNSLGDVLVLAGPFLDADEKPCGSLVVIKASSQEEAQEIAGRDPYVGAGLFASSEIRPWVWAVNAPEGL